jgi:hypothetical protein
MITMGLMICAPTPISSLLAFEYFLASIDHVGCESRIRQAETVYDGLMVPELASF